MERAKYDDHTGPTPMAFAIAAYGTFRVIGKHPREIVQIFRDMPELLGEPPEDGANVKLADMEKSAREIGLTVGEMCGPGVGYALVLFNLGSPGDLTYLGTGNRNDVIKMLRELVGKLEEEQARHS